MDDIKEKELKISIVREIAYGKDTSQTGDLYIPERTIKGTICLFHGGFWKMPYDKHQLDEVSVSLTKNGYAVWNIEYRRTGIPERQWIDTFEDAIKSVNHLVELQQTYTGIDLEKTIFMGHSAGGHLAIWLGNHNKKEFSSDLRIHPRHVIGLAPIVDLRNSFKLKSGGSAVHQLLQSTPEENPYRYSITSPVELLPSPVPISIFHGTNDDAVPIKEIIEYADISNRDNQNVIVFEIENGNHMDFIDPESGSTKKVIEFLNGLMSKEFRTGITS